MGFMKQNSRKKAENGDFQVVGSLLYAHYPIYFFLLHISKYKSFSDFSSMGVGLEKES